MKCFTEIDLEILASRWHLKQPSDEESFDHISVCSFCNERFEEKKRFYFEMGEYYKRLPTSRENALVKEIGPAIPEHVFIAFPYVPPQHNIADRISIMAAQSDSLPVSRVVENIGLLATQKQDVLVRIMRTVSNKEIFLHLISEREEYYRNVLVRLPFSDKDYIADASGKVTLGKIELPELSTLTVQIQTPFTSFDLSTFNLEQDIYASEAEVVLTGEDNNSIKVEFLPAELDYTLKIHILKLDREHSVFPKDKLRVLVTRGKNDHHLTHPKKGIAVFQGLKKDGEIRIQVFD